MIRLTTLILLITLLTSCRYNNYTPSEPVDDYSVDLDLDLFESPEKADIFYLGDEVPIEYKKFSQSEYVNVHIIKKGVTQYTLAQRTPNDGSFVWRTNDEIRTSVQYQVKIENAFDADIYIVSKRFGLISN